MNNTFTLAGVMGWPVHHSRSPLIHNHWIRQHNLNGAYGLFPVKPENLEAAVRGLHALGLAGCNVTIPHKVEALQHVDWIHPLAQRIGAINTIVVRADGALHGYNNDGFGYIQSLLESQPSWKANAGPAVIIGAGGAARAVVVALIDEGAREIRVTNRTQSKSDAFADEFAPFVKSIPWSDRQEALTDAALLVNTTSQGMTGHDTLDLELVNLPTQALVSDVIYAPLETPLLREARTRGNNTVNGLGMLIHQARPAFHAWFGVLPDADDAIYEKLKQTI